MISKNKWCENEDKRPKVCEVVGQTTATGHEARTCLLHNLVMQSDRVPNLSGFNDYARFGNL